MDQRRRALGGARQGVPVGVVADDAVLQAGRRHPVEAAHRDAAPQQLAWHSWSNWENYQYQDQVWSNVPNWHNVGYRSPEWHNWQNWHDWPNRMGAWHNY